MRLISSLGGTRGHMRWRMRALNLAFVSSIGVLIAGAGCDSENGDSNGRNGGTAGTAGTGGTAGTAGTGGSGGDEPDAQAPPPEPDAGAPPTVCELIEQFFHRCNASVTEASVTDTSSDRRRALETPELVQFFGARARIQVPTRRGATRHAVARAHPARRLTMGNFVRAPLARRRAGAPLPRSHGPRMRVWTRSMA
jgi:hypothetical protein